MVRCGFVVTRSPLFSTVPPATPNSDNVDPPLREIEEVRVEKRTDNVLHDHNKANPRGKAAAAK